MRTRVRALSMPAIASSSRGITFDSCSADSMRWLHCQRQSFHCASVTSLNRGMSFQAISCLYLLGSSGSSGNISSSALLNFASERMRSTAILA